MKIEASINIELPDTDIKKLPFVFNKNYKDFLWLTQKNTYSIAVSKKNNALMPFKKYFIKNFSFIQPLYPPISSNGRRLNNYDEKLFLDEFINSIRKAKIAIRIVQSQSYSLFKAVPENSTYCPFGSYILSLKADQEELFKALHPKHRNVIKNAEAKGIQIKWEIEKIEDFYSLYKETMSRSGLHFESLDYFKSMVTYFKDNLLCGIAYYRDLPQGAILLPYTKYGAYYLYGASANGIKITGTNNFLHWEAIKLLKTKGVERYDFCGARLSDVSGTKLEGIQSFKKRFGGELDKGFLWKIDIDPLKCKIFDNLLKINRTLRGSEPYKDIIDQEIEKTKKLSN